MHTAYPIYEDEDLLVLHKPSGLPSVPHAPEEIGATAVGAALAHDPALKNVGDRPLEPGLLHRLDTGTSGLLAFARNNEAYLRLREEWRAGRVRKTYRAWVTPSPGPGGAPELRVPQQLTLELGHDESSARRMRVVPPRLTGHEADSWKRRKLRGKAQPTRTELLAVHAESQGRLDLEIGIHTGAMHQIRATLHFLAWPILGDPVYRPPGEIPGQPASRLWLHAWKLGIPLRSGAELLLRAALPEGWAAPLVVK